MRYLFDQPHWRARNVTDLGKFFAALPGLTPPAALIGIAGGFWSDETRSILGERSAEVDEVVRRALPLEFRQALFIPATADSAVILAALTEMHAEPEIADHLAVVVDGRPILEWYDLPADPITIARSISEAQVRVFADATGGTMESVADSGSRC